MRVTRSARAALAVLAQWLLRVMELLTSFFSAEFLVIWWKRNGGAIVALRAFFVSLWIYGLGLLVYNIAECGFRYSSCSFDREVAAAQIQGSLKYYAGILGGAYAAFYARLSSQWHYLADLYNQIKAAQLTNKGQPNESLNQWKAAFIVDAYALHLSSKPMFASIVSSFSKDPTMLVELLGGTEAQEAWVRKVLRGAERTLRVGRRRDEGARLGSLSRDDMRNIELTIDRRIVAARPCTFTSCRTKKKAAALLRSTVRMMGQPAKAWMIDGQGITAIGLGVPVASFLRNRVAKGVDSDSTMVACWEQGRVILAIQIKGEGLSRDWRAWRRRCGARPRLAA